MEIIEHSEAFQLVDGKLSFKCVKGIIRIQTGLYLAQWQNRFKVPEDTTELHIVQKLNTEDRGPLIKQTWTVTIPECHYYIKTPDFHAFYNCPDLEDRIAREVETCELLKLYPHPNISLYFGCTELRGRVSGICFKKYEQTLLAKVNPQGLNKSMFLSSDHRRSSVDNILKQATDKLLAGIKHLHSLGIIHNDITPSNIMIDEDNTLVLIDFDSCRRPGEALGNTKRTYGWYNPNITTAMEQNDLDAFAELQTWLFGTSVDSYQFP